LTLDQICFFIIDMNNALVIFCDGGSRCNPGPAASGFVIFDLKVEGGLSIKTKAEIETLAKKITQNYKSKISQGEFLGKTTNNQAEWQAVTLALKTAVKNFETEKVEVLIFLDSQLVQKQILGEYKVKKTELKPHYLEAVKLLKSFQKYQIFHIPRKLNHLADAEVNRILDQN